MHRDLFSPRVEQRYQATPTEDVVLPGKWPVACGGAPNAFLALVGPSMGGAGLGQTVERGGANRPRRGRMRIGRDVQTFDWGDHRKARWTRLCAEMLGDEHYVAALTSLLNLDWRHSTVESVIPQEDLEDGFTQYVWPLLLELRPRLVCPLSDRTWDTIHPHIAQYESAPRRLRLSLADSRGIKPSRDPFIVQFPGYGFSTLLIKPHRHPSRALSYEQISIIGRACRRFLHQKT